MTTFYMDDSVTLHLGDALAVLREMPDESVNCVVTSPPYFGLRDYGEPGQYGLEATPTEYVATMAAVFAEARRVLAADGTLWLNLGDTYAGKGNAGASVGMTRRADRAELIPARVNTTAEAPYKSLLMLPERVALALIDGGWTLRNRIVWCLSGGARVYARTAGGERPVMLRDLARSYRPEDVQLWNGQRWTQALGWNKTPDDDGALELELRTGERIGCTPGHRWPTRRGVLRADEMTVGDIIETTRLPEPEAPRRPALLPDGDIGWLVGLYIAEGSRSGTALHFAGHVKEDIRHVRLAQIAAALDGTCHVYQTSENGVTANLHGSAIVGVIDRYVSPGTAKTKHLLQPAWQRSDAFLAAVMEGYLDGDGHYDAKNDRWRLTFSANDEWAADLRTLAARLGVGIRLRRAQHTGSYGTFPGWRGEWRWQRSAHFNTKLDGEVVAIRNSRARDFYDVGVADEPHLFALASGVLTHNSKPNAMPESVRDRFASRHEAIFLFAKSDRYWFDLDAVREPHSMEQRRRTAAQRYNPPSDQPEHRGLHTVRADKSYDGHPAGRNPGDVWAATPETSGPQPRSWDERKATGAPLRRGADPSAAAGDSDFASHENGPNPGDVWAIPTQPFPGAHFAVFPPLLAERCVLAGCRPGGTVLDPFCGSGTTGMVATKYGRRFVGIDLSKTYLDLALKTRLAQSALMDEVAG